MAFEKFIRPKPKGRSSQLMDLEIGEVYFLPEKYTTKLYRRLWGIQKRHKREYSYQEIKNGILIKRDA
jgi:hypothetical protein